MSDLTELRRKAAQQAGTGNYWAGKAVGLIDQLGAFGGGCLFPECGAEGVSGVTLFGHQVGSACEPHLHTIASILAAHAALDQLRADVTHAAEWLREPGVTDAVVWPWLLARAGSTETDTVEDE